MDVFGFADAGVEALLDAVDLVVDVCVGCESVLLERCDWGIAWASFEVAVRLILLDGLLDWVAELSECGPVNQRVLADVRRDSVFAHGEL